MRRSAAGVAFLLLSASVPLGALPASAQTSDGPSEECEQRDVWGRCSVTLPVPVPVEEVSDPGRPRPEGNDDQASGPSAGGQPAPPQACPWTNVPASDEEIRSLFPDAPPGAILQARICSDANPNNPGGTQLGLGARWVAGEGPAAEPPPPTPAAVALIAYARVTALMRAPTLVTNPPAGDPAIVDIPVFVEVQNWQGPLTDSQCVMGVCVDLTASPALEFHPGEPGALAVACEPPGTRYDATAGSAQEQAAEPGTCAYPYRQRTGVDGRPAEWPAEATVRWSVSWTSNAGVRGTFPDLTFSASEPRSVDEVQTVVADDE